MKTTLKERVSLVFEIVTKDASLQQISEQLLLDLVSKYVVSLAWI